MKIECGTRHATLTNIAIQMKAEGKSRFEAAIELSRLNTMDCEIPIRVAELGIILVNTYGTIEAASAT